MEGYHYPASGPMTAPRPPRFQFRAPGAGQHQPYQARSPQGYYDLSQGQARRHGPPAGQGMYYGVQGHRQPHISPLFSSSMGGNRSNMNHRPQRYVRPAAPLKAVDLTGRVVIPPPKEIISIPDCICERKVSYIICTGCGFLNDSGKTRARRTCVVHPKRLTYTDLACCPTCEGDIEEHVL